MSLRSPSTSPRAPHKRAPHHLEHMMHKSILIIAILTTALACKSEIDNKPAATVNEPVVAEGGDKAGDTAADPNAAKAPEAPAAAAGESINVAVSSDSKIEWVGAKVTGDHKGGFKTFKGTFSLTPDNKLSKVSFEVDTTSVFSDNDMLTGHLKSADFFDVEKFPTATFETTEIKEGGDNGATHTLTGNFTIRGVTKSISFPASVKAEGDKIEASSEFTIDRTQFEITYEGKADDLIKKEVLLKLNLQADLQKKG